MPSARCENLQCREAFVSADPEQLFQKALAHHQNRKTEGLIISLFGRAATKDEHHSCRDFQVFDDAGASLGMWHFANGAYSDRWSTATLLTGTTNSRHRFDIRDRGDRTENQQFYTPRPSRRRRP